MLGSVLVLTAGRIRAPRTEVMMTAKEAQALRDALRQRLEEAVVCLKALEANGEGPVPVELAGIESWLNGGTKEDECNEN